jgi:predicted  nucleic acid-binding Zn-ribbon protein
VEIKKEVESQTREVNTRKSLSARASGKMSGQHTQMLVDAFSEEDSQAGSDREALPAELDKFLGKKKTKDPDNKDKDKEKENKAVAAFETASQAVGVETNDKSFAKLSKALALARAQEARLDSKLKAISEGPKWTTGNDLRQELTSLRRQLDGLKEEADTAKVKSLCVKIGKVLKDVDTWSSEK